MQHTARWNCSIVDPSRADDQNYFTHSKATLFTNENSNLKPMGKRQATSPF